MKTALLPAALLYILCTGCNPARRIELENTSGGTAYFTWKLKEDSLHVSPFYLSNTDKTEFVLKNKKPYNRLSLSCGIGPWSAAALENLSDDLEYVDIRWPAGKIRLDSARQIRDFLWLRRKGLTNTRIQVAVK